MTNKHAGSAEDSDESPPVLTFQPRLLSDGSTPPNPTNAESHYNYSLTSKSETSDELLTTICEDVTMIRDAAKAGWVMYYPCDVETIDGDTTAPKLRECRSPSSSNSIVEDSSIRDDVYVLDTKWNVRLPPGTVLRAYPLFNQVPSSAVTTIPSVIARSSDNPQDSSESAFVPIYIPVEVNNPGKYSTADPCVQLLLTEEVAQGVPYEPLSDDELQSVEKHDRAMSLYPDWYRHHNASAER